MPTPRGEVAGALVGNEIAVVGGFLEDRSSSREVDLYSPAGDSWRRLPDLPVGVNHTMAASWRGRLYVVGGYSDNGRERTGWILAGGSWKPLPQLPYGLAAGGAAVVGSTLYVVGGVAGRPDQAIHPAKALALDLLHPTRWRFVPGPTPREHLGVASTDGRIYAAGGRTAGLDTNLALLESWAPGERAWRRLPSVPQPRGGTGLAAADGTLVSAGGEAPSGTIAPVYAYDVAARRWTRLPDLPAPRHGLAVVAAAGKVYVVGGGRQPGYAVSDVVESIPVGRVRG
jgi:non-specific serine/threonine protein kinase